MSFTGFTDPWYTEMIEQRGGDDPHDRAIITAACILAESIDQLTKAFNKDRDTLVNG